MYNHEIVGVLCSAVYSEPAYVETLVAQGRKLLTFVGTGQPFHHRAGQRILRHRHARALPCQFVVGTQKMSWHKYRNDNVK